MRRLGRKLSCKHKYLIRRGALPHLKMSILHTFTHFHTWLTHLPLLHRKSQFSTISIHNFGPFRSNSVPFSPFRSNSVLMVYFCPFGPFLSTSVYFSPLRSNLAYFDSLWSTLIQFSLIQSIYLKVEKIIKIQFWVKIHLF